MTPPIMTPPIAKMEFKALAAPSCAGRSASHGNSAIWMAFGAEAAAPSTAAIPYRAPAGP